MAPIVAALEARADAGASLTPRDGLSVAPAGASAGASATASANAPPRGRSRALAWVGAAVVAVAAAGAALFLRPFTARATRDGSALAPLVGAPAPACTLVTTEAVAVTVNDRLALLPDGAVVVARDIRRGIVMERLGPEGPAPFLRHPMFDALQGNYEDVGLAGGALDGHPAVLARIEQAHLGADVLGVWSERAGLIVHRVPGPIRGLAATGFGKGVVVLAATTDAGVRRDGNVGGVELYLLGQGPAKHELLERIAARATAVAASADRVAVAYATDEGLRSAVVDKDLARLGDVVTVAPDTSAPAVAFVGARVVVFFTHDYAGKRRLTSASYAPGDAAVSAMRVAVDEAVLDYPLVTARLPNGSYVLLWVATAGGIAKLRASPVGPDGALTGPTTLASGASFAGLTATSSDLGLGLVWQESPTSTRIARVSCAP
jgi:hypothetical protein